MKFTANEFARVAQLLEPASYAAGAAAQSGSVDCRGYHEALIVFSLGTFTATGDVTFALQESDDNSTFVAVTGATVAEKVQADDQTVYVGRVNLENRRRYLRVEYDVDDDAVIVGILAVLLHPKYGPATQVNAVSFNVS